MAFEDNKITQADLADKGVTGLPDTPGLTTSAMQAKFDELSLDVIVPKFNALCDSLDDADIDGKVASDDITNIKRSADNTLQVSTDGGETYNDLSSSGHIIVNGSGIAYTQRSRLQFSSNVVIEDKESDSATFISVPQGEKGDKGDAATIQVGSVQSGDSASVYNSGSMNDAIFNFTLPKGDQGNAATIQVGTVTSGQSASVSNRGTSSSAIFDFVLPKGDKGDTGQGINILDEYATLADLQAAHPTGSPGNAYMVGTTNPKDLYIWSPSTSSWKNQGELQGAKGDQGDAGTITIGTVTTGNTSAVENVGTAENAILNFTLEKGDQGNQGTAATIAVGSVSSGATASVTNSGTSSAAVFDFVLPKGDTGAQGDPTIVNGKTGASITVTADDIPMTGYSKAQAASSIATTDTASEAIGKLEYKIDNPPKSGHDVLDKDGTQLTQRDYLQFKGFLKAEDDSTNLRTVIDDSAEEVTWATWNAMTDAQRDAYSAGKRINITNVPGADGTISANMITKLWENPNPAQAFAGQNINLSSADYDFLLVEAIWSIDYSAVVSSVIAEKGKSFRLSTATHDGTKTISLRREMTYSSNTLIVAGDCSYEGAVNNSTCIPLAIYGIKKSFTFKVSAIASDVSTSASQCMLSDGVTSVEDKVTKTKLTITSTGTVLYNNSYFDKDIISIDVTFLFTAATASTKMGDFTNLPEIGNAIVPLSGAVANTSWVTQGATFGYFTKNGIYVSCTGTTAQSYIHVKGQYYR